MKQQENNTDLLQDETLSQKLIKKGFWLYLFSYLIAPGGYLIRLLISNSPEISVADVGILYSIISLISFLNVYNDLGLTESLQYFLPKFWIKKEYNNIKITIYLSFLVQFWTAILIALGLWFGSDWLAVNYFHNPVSADILKYFCLYFLWINLFQTFQSIFIAFQKTFDYQLVEFIRMRSVVWFSFFCFLTNRGTIERYSLNRLLWLGVWILIAGFIYYRNYHHSLMQGKFEWNKPMLKEYRKYALWSFIWLNISSVFWQIIQQLVLYFLGDESAGYFANFQSLFNMGFIIIWPIMSLIFPIVAEVMEKKDEKKLNLLISFFYSYFSVLICTIVLLFMTLWSDIWSLLFGAKFRLSGELLSYWAIFLIFSTLSTFNFSVLWGLGKVKLRVKALSYSTLIFLLSSIVLIPLFKIYGAVFSFWLSYLSLWIFSYFALWNYRTIWLDFNFISSNLIYLIILWLIIYLTKDIFFSISYSRLQQISHLVIITFIICVILALLNMKKISFILKEIKKISRTP